MTSSDCASSHVVQRYTDCLDREHLYRCHCAPIRCPRCWLEFQEPRGLERHLRSDIQCEKRQKPAFEEISETTLKLLKCKKRQSSDPGEEGKWRDIYGILFPGAPVPSPCKNLLISHWTRYLMLEQTMI